MNTRCLDDLLMDDANDSIFAALCNASRDKKVNKVKLDCFKKSLETSDEWKYFMNMIYYNKITAFIHVAEPYYSFIKGRKKLIEGKKCSPTYSHLKEGDLICFYNSDDFLLCTITKLNKYQNGNKSLENYLLYEGIENCLPDKNNLEDAMKVYKQWSTNKEIRKYGMMAIHFEHYIDDDNL